MEIVDPQNRPKNGEDKVVELTRPVETSKTAAAGVIESTALEVTRHYGQIPDNSRILGNATLNDIMLRGVMRFPTNVQESPSIFYDHIARIIRRAMELLGKRGYGDSDRAKFAEHLDGLSSSVFQLATFVRRAREKNPDWRFATSPWLDVFYGIDLLRAWPVWVPEKSSLDIHVTAYQAKANRRGLTDEDVRQIPKEYKRSIELARRDLAFDPNWVLERAVEEISPITQRTFDMAAQDLNRARSVLESLTRPSADPFEQWRAEHIRSMIVREFSEALGMEATPGPQIRQRGTEIAMRFIIDTRKGTVDLNEQQALEYGTPKAA